MLSTILEFLNGVLGHPAFIGTVLVLTAIFLGWFSSMLFQNIKSMSKKLDNLPCDKHGESLTNLKISATKIESLPCSKHENKMDEENKMRHELEKTVTRIDTSLSYLTRTISDNIGKQATQGTPFTQSHSPLSLTEVGKKKAEEMKLFEGVDKNWEEIKTLISENVEEKTAYDIQQYCLIETVVHPEKFLSDDFIKSIKSDAYKNGFPLTQYMNIVAVIVRDKYFDENGIDVNEVENHESSIQ